MLARLVAIAIVAVTAALGVTRPGHAQAAYGEGFNVESVAELEAAGWIFRNQSQPVGVLGWRPTDVVDPYEGTHYLVTDGYCVGGAGAGVLGSNWAIVPAVPDQIAGDELTVYLAEGWAALRYDVLELRYSPSGGTDTGSSASDVGDFTVVLAAYPHDTIGWWSPHSVTLPGSGRIAFRYSVPEGRAAGMYVDALTIGTPPAGPIPLPAPGETVHWDLSMSPIVFPGGVVNIPAGGTVIVESGVEVHLDGDTTLVVEGAIEFDAGTTVDASPQARLRVTSGGAASMLGTDRAPVVLRGSQNRFTPGLQVFSGSSLALRHVQAEIHGWISSGSTATVEDSTFETTAAGPFDAAGLRLYNATLAVRRSTFLGARLDEEGGYLLVDDLTLDASRFEFWRTSGPQPLHLDHVVARESVDDAPFIVHNFDVFLGPDTVIEDNLYPIRLETGGLAPGSVVPPGGNVNNHIEGLARVGRRSTWSDVGLPYMLAWDPDIPPSGGRLTIEPGVTALFRRGEDTVSDLFAIEFAVDLVCRGTPEAPISLGPAEGSWGGLFFGSNGTRPVLRHTTVAGADTGVIATDCRVRLESSTIRNNGIGATSNSFGSIIARGTRFENNGVGVQTSPGTPPVGINAGQADLFGGATPNSFVGNGDGVLVLNSNITEVDGRFNWWGAASGPEHVANPGGQGDSASPTVDVIPFRTAAPVAGDHAPLVTLQRVGSVLDEGTRMFLHWTVEDDGAIVAQRLEYSPHGSATPMSILIADIPAAARSVEVVVPAYVPSSSLQLPVFRLVATDDTGHEGWDERRFFTPFEDFELEFTVPVPAPVLRPGETVDVCWDGPYGDAYLIIEDVDYAFSLGGSTTNCLPLGLTAPGVSTDLARIAVSHIVGAGGRIRYEYSDYFSIRPDEAIGDEPPTVVITAPSGVVDGGSEAIIAWAASDDDLVRSITVQASYDAGRSWNVIVDDVPGTVSSVPWMVPASAGIDDVRLRVIARDLRFQASSDTVPIAIAPGDGTIPGDLDGDGVVGPADLAQLLAAWGSGDPDADLDGSGVVDASDLAILLANWG